MHDSFFSFSLSCFLAFASSMARPERTDTSVSHNALPTLRAGRTRHFTTRATSNAERACGDRERAVATLVATREASQTQNAADSSEERQCGIKSDVTPFSLFSVHQVVHMQSETFRPLRTRRFKSVYIYSICHFSRRISGNKWNASLDTCPWILKTILITRLVLNVDIGWTRHVGIKDSGESFGIINIIILFIA